METLKPVGGYAKTLLEQPGELTSLLTEAV